MKVKRILVVFVMGMMVAACAFAPTLLENPQTPEVAAPRALPRFESDPAVTDDLVGQGKALPLLDLADEEFQGEMFKPGTQRYTVKMKPETKVDLSNGWCASTAAILADNKKHFGGSISVNGYKIPSDELHYFEWDVPRGEDPENPDGVACFSWDIVASDWPLGAHRVIETWVFDQAVDDGSNTYAAGEYVFEYAVTVAK
jgi:hypothetical protein